MIVVALFIMNFGIWSKVLEHMNFKMHVNFFWPSKSWLAATKIELLGPKQRRCGGKNEG